MRSGMMKRGTRAAAGSILLGALLSSAGCDAQISDARRDHLLAGEHGWIDLSVTAAPKGAAVDPKKYCHLAFAFNGEDQLHEMADLAGAARNGSSFGYRFVAPAARQSAELTVSGCVPDPVRLTLPLDLSKDHLALLEYDGSKLVLKGSAPYQPASLEWVRGEILKLHSNNDASGAAVSRLTTLTIASLALNTLALLAFLLSRRRKLVQ